MAGKRKSPQQLNREIAEALRAKGDPTLAAVFADPEARRVFAREMRHELYKKQAAQASAAHLAARPFTVKGMESMGDKRFRSIFGRYPTEAEARAAADQIGGWVEHNGRVVYGRAEES